ncbi:MAG: hypothetical protein K6B67_01950 [Lachnospiraceae bacterium]|nr:hypothetical protein [Lachnospiraceae bacterium]
MMNKMKLESDQVYNMACNRLIRLEEVKNILENNMKRYPVGKIHIIKKNNTVNYYLRKKATDRTGEYIRRTENKKIKMYIQKSYDGKILRIINDEIDVLTHYVNKARKQVGRIESVYDTYPDDSKKFIAPICIGTEEYIKNWNEEEYDRKVIREDMPDYITDKGEKVRSKSEVLIANMLNKMNIPYRYECALRFKDGNVIYPDFTILDINRGCEVYWEHRGMMDDRTYANESVRRIREYQKNNIFLGDKLIITEESMKYPLDVGEIKNIIEHYFVKNE